MVLIIGLLIASFVAGVIVSNIIKKEEKLIETKIVNATNSLETKVAQELAKVKADLEKVKI